jgi:hypothetical protein
LDFKRLILKETISKVKLKVHLIYLKVTHQNVCKFGRSKWAEKLTKQLQDSAGSVVIAVRSRMCQSVRLITEAGFTDREDWLTGLSNKTRAIVNVSKH